MTRRKIWHITIFILCLLIGIVCGQDWLNGGYVGSYSGDIAQYFTDPIFFSNSGGQPFHFSSGTHPGPYGAYPFYPSPYYSDFRLNSLGGINWEPFQKNWTATMDYAKTKSSFRVYPRSIYTSPPIQYPVPTTAAIQCPPIPKGDSTAKIISQGMVGYQVYLDGNYVGTEGTCWDPLDGDFTFEVIGNQYHEVRVYDGQFNYPKTMFFDRGGTKIINVEPGTVVYI
jgi:hypothetical protein